jgi:SAM-dependent methyltransferase
MNDYDASTYGDRIADFYDDEAVFGLPPDTDATVGFLASVAGGGPVLELAIGTGRIALPLAQRGFKVHGIDASERMVARLRAKPGGESIPVKMGDFADVGVDGSFSLVFIVFNTFFALLTQEDQVRCFVNVARRLTPDGVFVIEVFVPDLTRFDRNQRTSTERVGVESAQIEASRHHPVEQRVDSLRTVIGEGAVQLYPVQIRYAWPSELDLMGRLAGLRLRERWGGWRQEPFNGESTRHISLYEPATP